MSWGVCQQALINTLKSRGTRITEYLPPVRVSRGAISTTPSLPANSYQETAFTISIMKAAFAVVCQESEILRTAPSIMNPSPPPPLMLIKEALNNYEMGAPTLYAGCKEVLSCVIIIRWDVCIAPPLSTVCQVRVPTSTVSYMPPASWKQHPICLLLSACNQRTPELLLASWVHHHHWKQSGKEMEPLTFFCCTHSRREYPLAGDSLKLPYYE